MAQDDWKVSTVSLGKSCHGYKSYGTIKVLIKDAS